MPLQRLFKVVCAHCKCTIVEAHPNIKVPGVVHDVCTACRIKTEQRLADARDRAEGLLT